MKNLFLTVLVLFSILNVLGQRLSGSINSKLRPDVRMHLARVEGAQQIDITSTDIKPDGLFDFGILNEPSGLYILYTTQKGRNFEFIIYNEPELEFKFLNSSLNKIEVIKSEENKLYNIYISSLKKKNIKVNSLKKKLRNPALSSSEKQQIQNQINVLEQAFFTQTSEQINSAQNSFFSYLIMAGNADFKDNKIKYFSDLNFEDENLIRSRVFSERFREYIVRFSGGEKYGFMDCIDDIMQKASVNLKVYEFAAYSMMEGFYNSGMEDLSNYILDEYVFEDACGGIEVGEALKNKGRAIKYLQVGNKPPNINLQNALNRDQSLYKTVSENNYTLVMFWSSTCHSCEAQVPIAKNLYNTYKNRGFEIFGVSIDMHKSGWTKALSENKMNWINVCDFKGWDSPITEGYRIVKTPTYFLLNKSGNIVAKPRHITEVQQILKKFDSEGGFR